MGVPTATAVSLAAVFAVTSLLLLARIARGSRRTATARDPLTGLPTHQDLVVALETDASGALLYLDLDRFEIVNETLGRHSGDRLMSMAACLLAANAREDFLVRIGGDEFAVLVRGASVEEGIVVAERIRRAVNDIRLYEAGHTVDLSVSIGVASIGADVPAEEGLRRANTACRAAKAQGRNRVEAYRAALSEEAQHLDDARWSVELKDAIRFGRLELDFQPIVGVGDHRVSHFEVLVRLESEDGSRIDAGAFIPTAERFGLIREVDRTVISETLERMAQEAARGNVMRCAINLSGMSLREEATLHFIEQELDASGADPRCVTFEITETAAIENLAQARRAIERLRALGCTFALDDFGKGLSSLTYLRYLPVDYLKIDGSFVRNLGDDPVNQAMVRSLNELSHSLGIRTIAECVEDRASLDFLERIGVDLAQGFLVGRPSGLVRATFVIPADVTHFHGVEEGIAMPPRSPAELKEFVDFIDALDMRSRALRDEGAFPAEAITRPDEFDRIAFEMVRAMRDQIDEAIADGAATVSIRLPLNEELISLTRWAEPRMGILAGMARSGLVQGEWARPLKTMVDFFDTVLAEIGHRQPA
jgi:diguanylate cyclase (GGDEF)-like protein